MATRLMPSRSLFVSWVRQVSSNLTVRAFRLVPLSVAATLIFVSYPAACAASASSCEEVFSYKQKQLIHEKISQAEILEVFGNGTVEVIRTLPGGRSKPLLVRVTLHDVTILAVMKDRGSEKGRRKEQLAYQLDQILGFDLVPATALRELPDGRLVSLQLFIEGSAAEWNDDIRLFTSLTGNIDRGGEQNVIADASGKQYAIDNEGIFMNQGPTLTFTDRVALKGVAPSSHGISRLKALASGELTESLLALLPHQDVSALVERAQAIEKHLGLR